MMASFFVFLNTSTYRSYYTAVEFGARVSLLGAWYRLGHPSEAAAGGASCGWQDVVSIVNALPLIESSCVASTLILHGVLKVISCVPAS